MKQDLGPSNSSSSSDIRHHPMHKEIETFEKEVKKRLLVKLLSDGQIQELKALQIPTLLEMKQIVFGQRRSNNNGHGGGSENGRGSSSVGQVARNSAGAGAEALSETCIDRVYTFTVAQSDLLVHEEIVQEQKELDEEAKNDKIGDKSGTG